MTTTIYQKFIPRLGETLTLVSVDYGDSELIEIVPHAIVAGMGAREFTELVNELVFWQNEKANWEE